MEPTPHFEPASSLEDLIALLPDNSTGEISAADLRTIVTVLWANDETLLALVRETDTESGESVSVIGVWQVNPQAGTAPQSRQVTCDTGLFGTATWLRFDPMDRRDVDMKLALMTATQFYIQQRSNSYNYVRYDPAGPAVFASGYVQVPVTVTDLNGSTGGAAWQDASVILELPAGVIAGDPAILGGRHG